MKVLVTGTAGFIGFHVTKALLEAGHEVVAIDSVNEYYDVRLKLGRLAALGLLRESAKNDAFRITDREPEELPGLEVAFPLKSWVQSSAYSALSFCRLSLENTQDIQNLFKNTRPERVCHLAAQAGVRYSLKDPYTYIDANVMGFLNILEGCRNYPVEHLVYASTSSIYGLNENMPFSVHDPAEHSVSLYAASKKANEAMAHSYSWLYEIPTTGLRFFFTVYGPWGRPDMAPILFAKAIYEDRPIQVFNHGDMQRDLTYIDDIVHGILQALEHRAEPNSDWDGQKPDPASSKAPFRLYNIGNSQPVDLMQFIETLEAKMGKKAEKKYLPMQPGDIPRTWADVSDLEEDLGYKPSTSLDEGLEQFVAWFNDYYAA